MEHSKLLMLHRESTEEIAPFLTIVGVDTFVSSVEVGSAHRQFGIIKSAMSLFSASLSHRGPQEKDQPEFHTT